MEGGTSTVIPASVEVLCGTLRGTLVVAKGKIVLEGDKEVSPTEFERLGGRSATKKWKQSIRLINPDGSSGRPVGEWLQSYGLDIRSSILSIVNPTIKNGESSGTQGNEQLLLPTRYISGVDYSVDGAHAEIQPAPWQQGRQELNQVTEYMLSSQRGGAQSDMFGSAGGMDLSGQQLDLKALYAAVKEAGGYQAVRRSGAWPLVAERLGLDGSHADAVAAVRNLYERVLLRYERQERAMGGMGMGSFGAQHKSALTSDASQDSGKLPPGRSPSVMSGPTARSPAGKRLSSASQTQLQQTHVAVFQQHGMQPGVLHTNRQGDVLQLGSTTSLQRDRVPTLTLDALGNCGQFTGVSFTGRPCTLAEAVAGTEVPNQMTDISAIMQILNQQRNSNQANTESYVTQQGLATLVPSSLAQVVPQQSLNLTAQPTSTFLQLQTQPTSLSIQQNGPGAFGSLTTVGTQGLAAASGLQLCSVGGQLGHSGVMEASLVDPAWGNNFGMQQGGNGGLRLVLSDSNGNALGPKENVGLAPALKEQVMQSLQLGNNVAIPTLDTLSGPSFNINSLMQQPAWQLHQQPAALGMGSQLQLPNGLGLGSKRPADIWLELASKQAKLG